MAKKARKKSSALSELQRYLLIGASFGLYFGWFFNPQREPSISVAITRTIAVTIVMFLFHLYQQGRENFPALLRKTPFSFLQYFIFFIALEGRHIFYDFGFGITETHLGGRSATAVVMIIVGLLMAFLYYWINKQE